MNPRMAVTTSTRPGIIEFDAGLCVGCGACMMMCSLYHEGVSRPSLSRITILRWPLIAEFECIVCRHCSCPDCYEACPAAGDSMVRDPETGLVYVEEDYCLACGECTLACPFEKPRIRPHPDSGTALKCDLCRGRPEGPICVEYCPVEALSFRRTV